MPTQRVCVYCEATDHRSVNCDMIVTVEDRRKQLGIRQLCFNCTGNQHHAAECKFVMVAGFAAEDIIRPSAINLHNEISY